MLHIILLILKIIGIILLCILGILLLAILCVLFVPVRYRIELNREEGEGKPPLLVRAKVTWLLHFVNILIRYPAEKAYVRGRIFIFTIFRVPEKRKKQSARVKQSKKAAKSESKSEQVFQSASDAAKARVEEVRESTIEKPQQAEDRSGSADTVKQDTKQGVETNTVQESDGQDNINSERDIDQPISEQKRARGKKAKRPGSIALLKKKLHEMFGKIKNILHKIKELFQNIQYTIQNLCDRIKSVLEQIGYYREIIASDVFQQSMQLCKGELAAIIKSIKPKKFEADLIIGTDDPAATGEILAIYGMLYPFMGKHVNVVGDFEQNRIEGRVFVKGKIRMITLVRTTIRIYFNKDIKKLIKLLKKEAV